MYECWSIEEQQCIKTMANIYHSPDWSSRIDIYWTQ